jgi:Uma2 family endonuclease
LSIKNYSGKNHAIACKIPHEIKVEVYRKHTQVNWSSQTLAKSNNLELNSVGLTLTMADIYEDVLTL